MRSFLSFLERQNNSTIVKEKKEAFGITVELLLSGYPRGYRHVAEKLKFGRSIEVRHKITLEETSLHFETSK